MPIYQKIIYKPMVIKITAIPNILTGLDDSKFMSELTGISTGLSSGLISVAIAQ